MGTLCEQVLTGLMLAVALSGGVSSAGEPPSSAAVAPANEIEGVLAVVGGSPITAAEIRTALAPRLRQLEHQRYELFEKAVEEAMERRLLELEAETRGISVDALLGTEVEMRLSSPTEEEIAAYYQANASQIDRPLDEISGQLRSYLLGQQRLRRRAELIAELSSRHQARMLMEPFRFPVDPEGGTARGPEDAPVTLIAFFDYTYAPCARLAATLERVERAFGERVRLRIRHFPAAEQGAARTAAEASLCAREQGRFWEMHAAMLQDPTAPTPEALRRAAQRSGLDDDRFQQCLSSGRHAREVDADRAAGWEAGVTSPSVLFINGRLLTGDPPFERIARTIEDELARAGWSAAD